MIHHAGAAGKIGATEIKLSRVYLRRRDDGGICRNFGHYARWAHVSSGIYPPDPPTLSRFCRYYLQTLAGLDLLAVWFNFGEAAAHRRYAPGATLCELSALEPFYHERPWSAQLAGKRVVVVSPFEKSIRAQYQRREKIWAAKPEVLPAFDLRIVRCPQLAGIIDRPEYPDWFAGLEALKQQLGAQFFQFFHCRDYRCGRMVDTAGDPCEVVGRLRDSSRRRDAVAIRNHGQAMGIRSANRRVGQRRVDASIGR
jgi:hypothetical protein